MSAARAEALDGPHAVPEHEDVEERLQGGGERHRRQLPAARRHPARDRRAERRIRARTRGAAFAQGLEVPQTFGRM